MKKIKGLEGLFLSKKTLIRYLCETRASNNDTFYDFKIENTNYSVKNIIKEPIKLRIAWEGFFGTEENIYFYFQNKCSWFKKDNTLWYWGIMMFLGKFSFFRNRDINLSSCHHHRLSQWNNVANTLSNHNGADLRSVRKNYYNIWSENITVKSGR